MIYLITGATHTGKTNLSQQMLETLHVPYLSLDHLKMGLIRSQTLSISPIDSIETITKALWPIVVSIIKTVIENDQHLIIEGCYIPFDYKKYFTQLEQAKIDYQCLVMDAEYIVNHFETIKKYANVIEKRIDDTYATVDTLLKENQYFLNGCIQYKLPHTIISEETLTKKGV